MNFQQPNANDATRVYGENVCGIDPQLKILGIKRNYLMV